MLPNYSTIQLTADFIRLDLSLPAGTQGTIIDVYPELAGYMVEFEDGVVELVPMGIVAPVVELCDMTDEQRRIVAAGDSAS